VLERGAPQRGEALRPDRHERTRRLAAAAETAAIGCASGSPRARVGPRAPAHLVAPRPHAPPSGGGRKRLVNHYPTLVPDLQGLVELTTRLDPDSALRWTGKSLTDVAARSRPRRTGRVPAWSARCYTPKGVPFTFIAAQPTQSRPHRSP
jgi:hypothetical protein